MLSYNQSINQLINQSTHLESVLKNLQVETIKLNTNWTFIINGYPSGVTCLSADYCFSELAL